MSSKSSDLIPIKSNTRTIRDCFRTCLYEVPSFQRPYSWDLPELKDYWADVVLAQGDFFFGSTVTWESESRELFNNTYSIIDGQQRLTTSSIILSVIRDYFSQISQIPDSEEAVGPQSQEYMPTNELRSQAADQAKATQKYLITKDDDGNEYPVITRTEPNYKEVVQNPSAIPSGSKWNGSAQQIGVARKFFEDEIEKQLKDLDPAAALQALKTIRNNVLKARLIQIELSSEEDGFLIFETLNARGTDLRLADLVKNLLVRGGAATSDDRNTIAGRWDRLVDRVQNFNESASNVDQFIWQSWNSRRPAVTEARLYKEILKLVGDIPEKHLEYLEELETDSKTYQYFDDLQFSVDTSEIAPNSALTISEVAETIRALNIFKVSVANSAILAVVRKYNSSSLMQRKQLIEVCRAIENFHFQFTALLNSGSTGGTRSRYNRFAVDLENSKSKQDVKKSITIFTEKLKDSLPNSDDAKEAVARIFYAPKAKLTNAQKNRSKRSLVAYVLIRFAQHSKTLPLDQDLTSWTIEHIRPQKMALGSISSPEYSIGNLTLLTKEANGELGDGDLSDKRSGLRKWAVWKDLELEKWIKDETKAEVLPGDIAIRSKKLAELAIEKVWPITA